MQRDDSRISRTWPYRFSSYSRRSSLKPTRSSLSLSSTTKELTLQQRMADALADRLAAGSLLNPQRTARNPSLSTDGFAIIGSSNIGLPHKVHDFDLVKMKNMLLANQRRAQIEKERLWQEALRQEDEQFERDLNAKQKEQLEKLKIGETEKPPQLSSAALQRIERCFQEARRRPNETVVSMFKIDLTYADLATLAPRKWLNDNVIDMYLNIVVGRDPERSAVFTTHFFTKLDEEGYSGVRRWALRKKLDVFKPEFVFVPVNQGNSHWTLAVINNKIKTISFYDSLPSGKGIHEVECLVNYLNCESKRLGRPDNVAQYERIPLAKAPCQTNGYDCGVFMCEVVNRLSSGRSLGHSQADMDEVRLQMANSILELKSKL